eukprot:scaffold28555_cov58-Phaeocystis_antarctica.AAC.4
MRVYPSRDRRVAVRQQAEPVGAVGVAGHGSHLERSWDGLEALVGRHVRDERLERHLHGQSGEMGGFGGGKLEHPRPWLGSHWAGLSLESAEPARAVRRALKRHRSRAGALPRGHFDRAAARSGQVWPGSSRRWLGAWRGSGAPG